LIEESFIYIKKIIIFLSLLSYSLKPSIIGRKELFLLIAPRGIAANGCTSRIWKEDMVYPAKGLAIICYYH
jgi:hypothetical protein